MEEIKNNDKNETLEIGKIFFANIQALKGIGILALYDDSLLECYADDPNTVDTITAGGNNVKNYTNPYIKNDDDIMLVALKYIGNSTFEEMSTGEKIRVGEKGLFIYNQNNGITSYLSIPGAEYTYLKLNYEDYIVKKTGKKHLSKYEYIQRLQNMMKKNVEYPLILSSTYNCEEISEKSKQIYLLHTDEERKAVIRERKKLALLDSKEVNERIASSIEKLKTMISEDVNMAYLENQLYDFKHNGRKM